MEDPGDVEAALRRSEKHLAAAQRITHCGSWELDLGDLVELNRNPLRWSDEVFRIFGYEPGGIEVTNESFFAHVHPDDRESIASAVRTAIETGTPYSIDHRVIRPDGSVRIVHEESELQCDASGRPIRMIGTVQDVTEERTTETQLVFQDRLATVGTLAAGVAHEINNPLASVIANLEMIERSLAHVTSLPPQLAGQLRDAKEGADRVRTIVRDLMVFARADDLPRGAIELQGVIESSLRLANHDLKHRARVIWDLDPIPPVIGNQARLGQVFLNLFRNAAHAIPDGDPDRHHVRVSTRLTGGRVVVEVTDTGSGIPPELRSRLFTPFVTSKRDGMGLGLSISHRIIAELGGELSFTSEPGQGTTFTVSLVPARALRSPQGSGTHPTQPLGRVKVLIIDDEVTITNALRRHLQPDHDVTVENDPIAALALIRDGGAFDVILCDLIMPRMNGVQLHRELTAISPAQAAATILMTGGSVPKDAVELLASGRIANLTKPFDLDHLRTMMGTMISALRNPR
ncbi:MAG: PAS domain-containing protein [Myxococcales bacterium]|nr:PAS domain-containing protein [Myxococcales bacterium]